MFHYVIFYTRVKYECEIHVESSEKRETNVKNTQSLFTHFFT